MENLTHTLVGILLSRAGLHRFTPRATAICVVAANIPDIDIVTAASPIDYLTYHRHITHALPALPVMAILAVLLVEGVNRLRRRGGEQIRWGPAFGVSLIATLSHLALDMTNAYGTRLWLPFSGHWSSWDALFIVDLWVWAILALPLLILLGMRYLDPAGDRKRAVAVAAAGLVVLVTYIGFRAVLHERVVAGLQDLTYEGGPPVRVAAFPAPLETFRWSALVETQDAFLLGIADARQPSTSPAWQRFEKSEQNEVLRAAKASPVARRYLDFASYGYAEIERTPGGHRVQFSDFRFRRADAVGFLCTVELDRDLNVTREDFHLWGGGGVLPFAQRVLRLRPQANNVNEPTWLSIARRRPFR